MSAVARQTDRAEVQRPTSSPAQPSSTEPGRPATAAEVPFLEGLTIDYGPLDLLGRFFLKADAAIRRLGVTLSFAPMRRLAEVNQSHRQSWRPLLPQFDPDQGGFPEATAFCIVGRNGAGDIVATQAARLYTWAGTTFHEEAESLRLFYADPAVMQRPDETCAVTAPAARLVRGRVAFSGGVWYRPDYRGRHLIEVLPRISRALAFTRWYTDVTMAIMAEGVAKGGTPERSGYTNVDWEVMLTNSPVGTVRCALTWMHREQMLSDLEACLGRLDAEVDAVVHKRTA